MSAGEGLATPSERIVLTSDTDTVRLMQYIPEDAETIAALIAYDPDHLRQHGDNTADKYPNADAVRESILHPKDPSKYRFGIWDGETMVGSDNLTPKGEGRAELGSWIGRQYIGHEYAGRGRALLIDFAFKQLGLDEVFCDIVVGNESSQRSVEKSGFHYAGEITGEDGERKWRYVLRRHQQ